jgi:ribosomal protein S13
MLLQSTLKKQVSSSINFKVKRGFVSGLRHSQRLPSRGQRTKTNSRTNKNRRSLG